MKNKEAKDGVNRQGEKVDWKEEGNPGRRETCWVTFTLERQEMRVEEIRRRSKCSSCDPEGKF